ncbi:DUF4124 domain-containing protein [Shewanella sp. SR44-3]|nr:DUF4124 domain-containing protein [Shewanella sp. SR44-3]
MRTQLHISWLLSALLLSLSLSGVVIANTVYRWVDDNGKVHYSDTPVKNAQVFDSKENTRNQVKVTHGSAQDKHQSQQVSAAGIQYQVSIVSPTEEATLRDNNGEFSARVSVMPETPKGSLIRLILDDQPYGQAQTSVNFNLKAVERGEHTLIAELISQSGKVLASSPSRRIFLHQANLKSQAKPKS